MKHIGIVACSAEGAALCYRTICVEGESLMGEHKHPEVSMHTYSLGDYMDCIYKDDWKGVANLMISSGEKLARIGADFLICPDNRSCTQPQYNQRLRTQKVRTTKLELLFE